MKVNHIIIGAVVLGVALALWKTYQKKQQEKEAEVAQSKRPLSDTPLSQAYDALKKNEVMLAQIPKKV